MQYSNEIKVIRCFFRSPLENGLFNCLRNLLLLQVVLIQIITFNVSVGSNTTICQCLLHGALDSQCVKEQEANFKSHSPPLCYSDIFRNLTAAKWFSVFEFDAVFGASGYIDAIRDSELAVIFLNSSLTTLQNVNISTKSISVEECKEVVEKLGQHYRLSASPGEFSRILDYRGYQLYVDTKVFTHLHALINLSKFSFWLRFQWEAFHLSMSVQLDLKTNSFEIYNYTLFFSRTPKTAIIDEFDKIFIIKPKFETFSKYHLLATVVLAISEFGFHFSDRFTMAYPISFSKYVTMSKTFSNINRNIIRKLIFLQKHHTRIPKMNLQLISQRVFNNSAIQLIFEWKQHRDLWTNCGGHFDYEIRCKFFSYSDFELYTSTACKLCYHNLSECHNCMEEEYYIIYAQPQIRSFSEAQRNVFSEYSYMHRCRYLRYHRGTATFSVITNLNRYTQKNGSLYWNPPPNITTDGTSSSSFNLVLLNWYLTNINDNKQIDYLKHTVVIFGPRHEPRSIPNDKIQQNYFALCAARRYRGDRAADGPWSSGVKVSFNPVNVQIPIRLLAVSNFRQIILLEGDVVNAENATYRDLEYIKLLKKLDRGNFQFIGNSHHGVVSIIRGYYRPLLACYHYIFDCWYFLWSYYSDRLKFTVYCSVSSDHLDDERITYSSSKMRRKMLPFATMKTKSVTFKQLSCPELHSYLIFSAILNNSEVGIFRVDIDPVTGIPISVSRLDYQQLCKCSQGSNISQTSHYIDTVYQELNIFNEPMLMVVCNNTICLHDTTKDKKVARLPENGTGGIDKILMDSHHLYIVHGKQGHQLQRDTMSLDNSIDIKFVQSSFAVQEKANITKFNLNDTNVYKDAINFPVPPAHCMFPTLEANVFTVYKDLVRIEAASSWNQEGECKTFAKPVVIFQVKYYSSVMQADKEIVDYPCFSERIVCKTVKHVDKLRSLSWKAHIEVTPGTNYHFEVIAMPALNDTVHRLWYSGTIPSIFKQDINTTFLPKVIYEKVNYTESKVIYETVNNTVDKVIYEKDNYTVKNTIEPNKTKPSIFKQDINTTFLPKVIYEKVNYTESKVIYETVNNTVYKVIHEKDNYTVKNTTEPNTTRPFITKERLIRAGGISIPAFVIILLPVCIWYRRKYYIYKSLNRLSKKDIQKEGKLGEGRFGEVWKATLYGKEVIVVKMLKETATDLEEKQFREEALLLSKFQSENIVKPMGICLQSRPTMLALEFMNGSSVEKYLRSEGIQNKLKMHDLFLIVEHAANGCLYLEKEGYIHRDLSARNLLVQTVSDTNLKPNLIKLSDFGLAKDTGSDIYKSKNPEKELLPVAWCAPETFNNQFSTKSDIWAFGVVMWEVFSWASTPYRSCSMNHNCPMKKMSYDGEVQDWVCQQRNNLSDLEPPCNAMFSKTLCKLMEWCWAYDPDERLNFCQLHKSLIKSKQKICKLSRHNNIHQRTQIASDEPEATIEPPLRPHCLPSPGHQDQDSGWETAEISSDNGFSIDIARSGTNADREQNWQKQHASSLDNSSGSSGAARTPPVQLRDFRLVKWENRGRKPWVRNYSSFWLGAQCV